MSNFVGRMHKNDMKKQSNLVRPTKSFSLEYLRRLESALRLAFTVDTCYPAERKDWSQNVPAIGQCAVAALVVQDYLGGDIVYDQINVHFWNRVDGADIDLSREQFPEDIILQETRIRTRQELLEGPRAEAAETLKRYQILSTRVKRLLSSDPLFKSPVNRSNLIGRPVNSDREATFH